MNRILKKAKKVGTSPGTLVYIGDKPKKDVDITIIEYSKDGYEEHNIKNADRLRINENNNNKDLTKVRWLNINDLHEIDIIEEIGKQFKIHPLVLEDILNTGQRTKVDDYDDYMFIVLKALTFDESKNELTCEQISFVLIDNYIISFQEARGAIFENIVIRIKAGKGNIRKLKADYLLYALIDAIVDSYFVILEKIGNKIDEAEESLMEDPKKEVLQSIHNLKREMLFIRNSIWPLREVINVLLRSENTHINESTVVYLRDVYDHIIQVIDTIEIYRDMLSGMLDTYLSSISNKTNEVMKVLTILSTIFLPVTCLAGIYGMNFNNMPEYHWRWSYLGFWFIAGISTILMIRFFKRKKWL